MTKINLRDKSSTDTDCNNDNVNTGNHGSVMWDSFTNVLCDNLTDNYLILKNILL